MAFIKIPDEELTALGLVSQDNADLCKESGQLKDNSYRFKGFDFNTASTQLRNKYEKIDSGNIIYTLSDKVVIADGFQWTAYEFYKEV